MGSNNPQSIAPSFDRLPILGAHVRMAKPDGLVGSVKESLKIRATAGMVFLGPPRNTRPCEVEAAKGDVAKALWESNGRNWSNLAVHFRYVLNPSSPIEEKGEFAARFFDGELSAMEALGLGLACFHPGSSLGTDRLTALDRMVERLRPVFKAHPKVRVGIETMAGKANETMVGLTEAKLALERFQGFPNVGICLDTCHLWDSGIDLTNLPVFLDQVAETIGFDKVFLIHLNDSKNPRGAGKDRHADLGQGYIGIKALAAICGAEAFQSVPKILETPDPGDGSIHAKEIAWLDALLGH